MIHAVEPGNEMIVHGGDHGKHIGQARTAAQARATIARFPSINLSLKTYDRTDRYPHCMLSSAYASLRIISLVYTKASEAVRYFLAKRPLPGRAFVRVTDVQA